MNFVIDSHVLRVSKERVGELYEMETAGLADPPSFQEWLVDNAASSMVNGTTRYDKPRGLTHASHRGLCFMIMATPENDTTASHRILRVVRYFGHAWRTRSALAKQNAERARIAADNEAKALAAALEGRESEEHTEPNEVNA